MDTSKNRSRGGQYSGDIVSVSRDTKEVVETKDVKVSVTNIVAVKATIQDLELKPHIGSESAAGADLKMNTTMDVHPDSYFTVDTGLAVEIPPGYFGLVVPRSSMGLKGLMLRNTCGVIDSDYRGEIKLAFEHRGDRSILLRKGERVAQLILVPYVQPKFIYVEALESTERGSGGFGSTGS